jgi:hypothetical protein
MAPETYQGAPYDGRAIDVWCLGVMLFVLLWGIFPYKLPSSSHCAYFREIEAGRLAAMLTGWGFHARVSPEALDLVVHMLTVDPLTRPTAEHLHLHPWFAPERKRLEAEAEAAAAEDGVGFALDVPAGVEAVSAAAPGLAGIPHMAAGHAPAPAYLGVGGGAASGAGGAPAAVPGAGGGGSSASSRMDEE